MIKDEYYIKEVDKKEAQDLQIKFHYLHRKAPCSYAYGLFERDADRLVGIVLYGVPASRSLQKGVCGKEHANEVGELTRLWIEDGTPKNVESFLIGNTIKKQGFKILVSYAEVGVGHVGYVYQATNWIYTGLSAKRTDVVIDGIKDNKHCRHICDKYGGQKKAREILGDRFQLVERPRKHRYVYFNCGNIERKRLMKELKYKIQPYPKK